VSKADRKALTEHPRAIPRTGEDLARAAKAVKAPTATPAGQPAAREDVQPAERDKVYVGGVGTPDDDEVKYPPGTTVTASIPW
jgi:hypothetical protein